MRHIYDFLTCVTWVILDMSTHDAKLLWHRDTSYIGDIKVWCPRVTHNFRDLVTHVTFVTLLGRRCQIKTLFVQS